MDTLLTEIEALLSSAEPSEAVLAAVLDRTLDRFGCTTGTIHALDPARRVLTVVAARGIPDTIRARVAVIPVGKGMAGLAAERREPVQVCNLQTDDSGVAKPGARLTEMKGSIALPILVDDRLRGTLGVAKPNEYEFSADEIALLMEVGGVIGKRMG